MCNIQLCWIFRRVSVIFWDFVWSCDSYEIGFVSVRCDLVSNNNRLLFQYQSSNNFGPLVVKKIGYIHFAE